MASYCSLLLVVDQRLRSWNLDGVYAGRGVRQTALTAGIAARRTASWDGIEGYRLAS